MRRRDLVKLVLLGIVQAGAVVAFVLLVRATVDRLQALNLAPRRCPAARRDPCRGVARHGAGERRGVHDGGAGRLRGRAARARGSVPSPHRHVRAAVQRSSQGALLLRFTGDLSTLRTWISRGLARGIVSSDHPRGRARRLVLPEPVHRHSRSTGVLFLGAAVSAAWGYNVRRANRAVRWRRSLLASNIAEQVSALAVIQVFGRTAANRAGSRRRTTTSPARSIVWLRREAACVPSPRRREPSRCAWCCSSARTWFPRAR